MIDYSAVRAKLADIATTAAESVSGRVAVYPAPPSTLTAPQFVLIGQPNVTGFEVQPCIDRITWAVAAVVDVGGSGNFAQAQTALEQLWPAIADGYREATEQDQTLGGLVVAAEVTRAEFGEISVAGTQTPAQNIILTLHG